MTAILIIGGVADFFLQEKIKELTLEKLDAISSIQKERINLALESYIKSLETINVIQLRQNLSNYLQENNRDDLIKLETMLNDGLYSNDDFRKITLVSVDGNVIASTDESLSGGQNFNKDFFSEIQSNQSISMDYNQEPILYFSTPLTLDGESLGVLMIESKATAISLISQDYTGLGKTGETLLAKKSVDGNALVITPLRFESDVPFSRIVTKDQIDDPITQSLLFNEKNLFDATDYRGKKVLAVTKYIESTEWGLVSKIDSLEAFDARYEVTSFLIGVVIILSGVMASFSLFLSDEILKPILKLKNQVEQFKIGNFDEKLMVKGDTEITSLTQAFGNLQQSLVENKKINQIFEKKLKSKLRERNELKKAIDESACVTITDKKGNITYVNERFSKVTKFQKEELIGHSHISKLNSGFHPNSFFVNIWETISKGKVWNGNIKNKTKDDSYLWFKTTITPMFGDDGKPEEYIFIRTDITKQKTIEVNLANALEDLRDADKRKEEFSTMVSHELKTPLTPIKFNTEMLLESDLLGTLNSEQLNSVKEIEINATRLENLISDILYAQKLDMNRMAFNVTKFNTGTCIERVTKNLLPLIQEKGIELEIKDSYAGDVFSDESRIYQIMENLIKNSVDFVPEKGGKISIETQDSHDFVIFCVKDNGIGIPKEKTKHLFKKFYQVDTSHTRKHGGTGLGLVICKGFVEGLGGKIWFKSEEGKMTTFFFSIPKKQELQVKV